MSSSFSLKVETVEAAEAAEAVEAVEEVVVVAAVVEEVSLQFLMLQHSGNFH